MILGKIPGLVLGVNLGVNPSATSGVIPSAIVKSMGVVGNPEGEIEGCGEVSRPNVHLGLLASISWNWQHLTWIGCELHDGYG